MASVTRFPSSNNAGWTNSNNGHADDGSYATAAPSKNGTTAVEYGGFGFDGAIPDGATINSATLEVQWKVSTASSVATLGASAWVNNGLSGQELVNSAEPTSDTIQSTGSTGITLRDQLLDGTFEARIRASRGNSNTAFTASLDYVKVTVDYTPALNGAVSFAGDATAATSAGMVFSSTATFAGAGTVSATAGVTFRSTVTFTGAAAAQMVSAILSRIAVDMAGTGAVGIAATRIVRASLESQGAATFVATATLVSGGTIHLAVADWAAVASAAFSGRAVRGAEVSAVASGSASFAALRAQNTALGIVSSSSAAFNGELSLGGRVLWDAAAQYDAAARAIFAGSAEWEGAASASFAATIPTEAPDSLSLSGQLALERLLAATPIITALLGGSAQLNPIVTGATSLAPVAQEDA